jgi:SAM-dependent methyltransferase
MRQIRDARVLRKRLVRNQIGWQRRHWERQLALDDPYAVSAQELRWGTPGCASDRLGDYARVLKLLQEEITPSSRVLEIGSYSGKWTQHMSQARLVICVDLFEASFDFLKKRVGDRVNLEFYKTRGDELRGIAGHSIDLVFTMDTLMRIPRRAIRRYLTEIFRVLAPGGSFIVHLPCREMGFCRGMYFTSLSRHWIDRAVRRAGFHDYVMDSTTLHHGVLLLGQKSGAIGAR